MVLEAVMVVVDNSESSRNGDYQPTRFDAQADAVNVIFQTITNGNPESSVGLMSMGGKGPEVLVTLTTDQGKILDGLHRTKTKIKGSSHLATGIQVAGLALKHRQNKSQRQRIIVFVCSPIEEEEKKLVTLAKKMKKGNVSVDFVLFGDLDDDDTQKKLQAFNESVKGGEGSNLVVIPPSSKLLSDQLISSPILLGDAAGGSGAGGGGESSGGNFGEFDFDPAMDPELALALRMSMEDEKARQEKKAKEDAEAANKGSLEDIKEEGENAPLLNKDGGESSKKNDKKDDDKMDTS
ncbi:26S proteasome non-ATPase regulatory subunit 4-like protein [Colletotrichum orbiculare MAFF 240422]|uniref:26S proteasome non-ATPase regulatory subunit 4-like protein n=3 Tax=Colletotrichum orbiculare species complex TaxID=2707354 RepID=N4V458_COLOR|nr:26S proteasome non-ATPase regulatory subunit 4-like protein [Colletotrichum orbiculare MAFF 240422]TDZ37620.1 26S proteasome non-ATPase regulatory subunit 4-like protein [Colletotrichum spinosum]TDZ61940.1 26S proteasome non-ATPase regulatory subunit 4-like protein [Colletotrichum trifolii]